MNKTKEIELLTNATFHTMIHNGYIINAFNLGKEPNDEIIINGCIWKEVIVIKFNKEYFN